MPDFSKMPEAFVSSAELATAVSREVKAGRLRKLGSRLYTSNLKDSPEEIVHRNLWPLVAAYLSGGLIADRTALENRPAPDGSVFLIGTQTQHCYAGGDPSSPQRTITPRERQAFHRWTQNRLARASLSGEHAALARARRCGAHALHGRD